MADAVRGLVRGATAGVGPAAAMAASAAVSAVLYAMFHATAAVWQPAASASDRDDRVRLSSYAVSTLHAVAATLGGLYCYALDDGGAYERPEEAAFGDSPPRHFFLMLTAGYLLYDSVLILRHRSALHSPLTLVHHALILFCFTLGVYTRSGTYYMASFLVNEASTLPLNANFFMAASPRWRGGTAYRANGVVLLVLYATARVAFNFFNLHHLVLRTWVPYAPVVWPSLSTARRAVTLTCSTLAFGHVAINAFWFVSIVRAVRRKLGRPRPSPRAKAE